MAKLESTDRNEQIERRQYIRLNVVFPVEFQFIDRETSGSISEIKQGFTRNIGKGGICLEVNNIEEGFEQLLKEERLRLDLRLHIPLSSAETKAIAKVAWYQKLKSGYPNKYLIGLSFLQIVPKDRDRIYFYARKIVLIPKLIAILVLFLASGLVYFYLTDIKLKIENKKMIQELVQLSTKKSELEEKVLSFDKEEKATEYRIVENQSKIEQYKAKIKDLEKLSNGLKTKEKMIEYLKQDKERTKRILKEVLSQRARFHKKVVNLSEESTYLKNRICKLSSEKSSTEKSLKDMISSFNVVEDKSVLSMYKWIRNHQNRCTGLVVSYEGDKSLEDWSFTYDQSLAAQCFTLMGDQRDARDIFEFYKNKAEKINGGFVNAYDAYTGKFLEYTVHSGPNIWLGIAILHYTNKFKDEAYLSLAEEIADWLIGLQKGDKEFGIKGGPDIQWVSTEHNLDAYAFFGVLYKITDEQKYLEAQNRVFEWIKKNAFNRREGRINRGKGDATIATDTFAWAIAAIGPQLLKESGMNPDQIIDFAEANCLVKTDYKRPDGERLNITGFDFGKYEHLARGGVVSTEWTAQMIVTLRIMSDYYKQNSDFQKAGYYKKKADFYLTELEKMIIASPSRIGQGEGCLPYATQDDIDTGHGWRVAQGTRTGSTAGTAYTIFAKYNYNPLILD